MSSTCRSSICMGKKVRKVASGTRLQSTYHMTISSRNDTIYRPSRYRHPVFLAQVLGFYKMFFFNQSLANTPSGSNASLSLIQSPSLGYI